MTQEEFNHIALTLRPRLINFARRYIGDGASTPEDMVQDALLKLWNSSKKEEIRNPEALTLHILKNLCLDYLKLKKNRSEELNTNSAHDSDSNLEFESRDEVSYILKHINSLPTEQMLAVALRDVMGLEFSEIATLLKTSQGNARTLLSRARKSLREKLLLA